MSRRALTLGGLLSGLLAALAILAAPAGAGSIDPLSWGVGPMSAPRLLGPASARTELTLVVALRANTSGLERFAAAVSDPHSPQYGHYEGVGELARRFGAAPAQSARVLHYLRAHGASDVRLSATGLLLSARMPVRSAQTAFGVSLERFLAAGQRFVAPDALPRLPGTLRAAALAVIGLDTRPLVRAEDSPAGAGPSPFVSSAAPRTGTPRGCRAALRATGLTPNQYLSAYGYTPLARRRLSGAGERVALIEIDAANVSDLRGFTRCFGLRTPPVAVFDTPGVLGALPDGPETTLDLQMLAAGAPGLRSIDVYNTSADAAGSVTALAAPLDRGAPRPAIISNSTGLCERDLLQAAGAQGVATAEALLAEAAADGITYVAASGDTGSEACQDSSNQSGLAQELAVNFPASSPWVTAVGGTGLRLSATNQILSQPVWDDGAALPGAAGSGGASTIFARPAYQDGTVPGANRELPDVSLFADPLPGYDVFCQSLCPPERFTVMGGTSAGAPLLAAGFALVDQDLRAHHRRALGFVNPLLYTLARASAPVVFDDVTLGSDDLGQQAFGAPLGCCSATVGFDEASGWGSLNLAAFDRAALAAQPLR